MKKTVLLAVDAERHVSAAADLTRELARGTGDRVIVLHVHEFAVGRFGRLQVDCPEGEGERLVTEIVSELRNSGITAEADIRETKMGHIARTVLEAAEEHDARIVVLGSGGPTDMPHLPFGSVSHRLLHWARRPVLIVPRQPTVEVASLQRAAETVTA
jgi:nucleotide-binding universal stress UspA family protein